MSEHFDNLVREQLSEYSPEVPSYIWDQIAKRKKKRGFIFLAWISYSNNKKRLSLFMGLLLIPLLLTQISNNFTGSKSELSEAGRSGKMNVEMIRNSEKSKRPVTSASTSTKKININASITKAINKKENASHAAPVSKKIIADGGLYTLVSPGSTEKVTYSRRKKEKLRTTHRNTDESMASPNEESNDSDNPANMPNTKTAADLDRDKLSFSFKMRKEPVRPEPISNGIVTKVIPCPEQMSAGNKKYLDFYFSPDYTIKTYKDTNNSEYLRRRKESVSNVFSYSVGARYTKVFNNSMSIRAGVNYSRIIEKMSTVEGNVIKIEYITQINANGRVDTIGNYYSVITRYKTTYNHYHTIDIPLALGYEFGNGNFHGNLNAGVIANIYSWQKGNTLNDTLGYVSINRGGPASPYQFKSNVGIAFSGSLSVYYRLQGRMELMAEPYFRYSLSAANKEEITLKQKFHTVGLRLGIRYDLIKAE
jgi:hypothetical protein